MVCSLTWGDLDVFEGSKPDIGPWMENAQWRRGAESLAASLGSASQIKAALEEHPMAWLIAYLREPDEGRWRGAAVLSVFAALAAQQVAGEEALAELSAKLRGKESMPPVLVPAGQGDRAYAVARLGGHAAAALLVHAPLAALGSLHDDPSPMSVTLVSTTH